MNAIDLVYFAINQDSEPGWNRDNRRVNIPERRLKHIHSRDDDPGPGCQEQRVNQHVPGLPDNIQRPRNNCGRRDIGYSWYADVQTLRNQDPVSGFADT